MKLDIAQTATDQGAPLAIALEGRFDANECETFRSALAVSPGPADHTQLVIDLSGVTFVDSTALAELVALHKSLSARGGGLVLHNPANPVRVILELTRLDAVFTITGDAAAA